MAPSGAGRERRMKSVLISIRPEWCKKIASGEKTIEVRRTRPKLETPFKCYVYMTYGKTPKVISLPTENGFRDYLIHAVHPECVNGKVIGEFVCGKIETIVHSPKIFDDNTAFYESLKKSCMSIDDFENYAIYFLEPPKNQGSFTTQYPAYFFKALGWHISNLKIYDKPKGLEEFEHYCKKERKAASELCKGCKYCFKGTTSGDIYCDRTVLTAPQSWCYVEEL